jgi:hypothetical protein
MHIRSMWVCAGAGIATPNPPRTPLPPTRRCTPPPPPSLSFTFTFVHVPADLGLAALLETHTKVGHRVGLAGARGKADGFALVPLRRSVHHPLGLLFLVPRLREAHAHVPRVVAHGHADGLAAPLGVVPRERRTETEGREEEICSCALERCAFFTTLDHNTAHTLHPPGNAVPGT